MAAQNVINNNQAGMPSSSQSIPAAPSSSAAHNNSNSSNDLCGTCNGDTGADAIGCDRCTNWFHPSTMCSGLPDQLIATIQQYYGGTGIVFVCTECRTSNNNGSDDSGGDVSQSGLVQSPIRLILEFGSTVRNTGYLGDLQLLESVQHHWTKHIDGPVDQPAYADHLKALNLSTLYKAGS